MDNVERFHLAASHQVFTAVEYRSDDIGVHGACSDMPYLGVRAYTAVVRAD